MQACRLTLNKAQCPGLLPFNRPAELVLPGWGGVSARAEVLRSNTLFAVCVRGLLLDHCSCSAE